jgi:hypothetical protein
MKKALNKMVNGQVDRYSYISIARPCMFQDIAFNSLHKPFTTISVFRVLPTGTFTKE